MDMGDGLLLLLSLMTNFLPNTMTRTYSTTQNVNFSIPRQITSAAKILINSFKVKEAALLDLFKTRQGDKNILRKSIHHSYTLAYSQAPRQT